MATFDIHLFSTAALEGNRGWTPVEKAETYLQEAWNHITGHDANIDVIYDDVYAPTQQSQEQITDVPHPCLSGAKTDYDNLLSWWLDYVHCEVSSSDTASDINCLITNAAPNGDIGIGNSIQSDPPVCVSEGGPSLPDLPAYEDHGSDWGGPFDAMQTVLHECGHLVLDLDDDKEAGGSRYWNGTYHRTPMYKDTPFNICGNTVNEADYGDWSMLYSRCFENYVTKV